MTSVRVPGFLPSRSGFHFRNAWPHEPDAGVLTADGFTNSLGGFPIGDANMGLCGGMAYAVRDMFEQGVGVPVQTTNPSINTPLFEYIFGRLIDSFDIPWGVGLWQSWSSPFRNQARDMVLTEWPAIRAELTSGMLVAVGLVRVQSIWPWDWGANHQIIAWGFDEDVSHNVSLLLYDPNHPDDDNVTLSFNASDADARITVTFATSEGVGASDEGTFGAFRVPYTHVDPRPMLARIQSNWRWCSKCHGLFFAGHRTAGVCPRGGGHLGKSSPDYTLNQGDPRGGQTGWRWCRKCQALFFADNPTSVCPAGESHDPTDSGEYVLVKDGVLVLGATLPFAQGQGSWKWCNKCQGMFHSGPGACPAGASHDSTGSGDWSAPGFEDT